MFKNKIVKTIEKPSMVEPKVPNPLVHIVDVNMALNRSKVIEEQMFKDKEPIKMKFVTNLEEEHRLQQSFVKTIQEMQIEDPP
jgi:hypothetical protein